MRLLIFEHFYLNRYPSARECRHPVVLGITFTCVVFLVLIVLIATGYCFIHKTATAKKGLAVVSQQHDPDTVIKDVMKF